MSNGLAHDIWVQNVCKGYQQMTKVVASKERVKDTLDLQNKACNCLTLCIRETHK